ncbi:hypothetical protein CLU79DRAFT_723161 [Phycomyces nitens]|nr:hypothetical protein CLU79DRAFT_723161 [Phycomyces nitens]
MRFCTFVDRIVGLNESADNSTANSVLVSEPTSSVQNDNNDYSCSEDFEVVEDAEDCDDDEIDPTSALLKNEKNADQFDEKQLLHGIYNTVTLYSTQQEISDAIKILEKTEAVILKPAINMDLLMPPSTNTNRKGRKSKRGKKRKLTLLVRAVDGSFSYPDKSTIKAKEDTTSAERDLSHRSSAYDSVGADGNCGFRAVSFGVHKDQYKWMDQIALFGQTDLSLWFSTFICPQIVADTYQRPVIIYTYSEHSVRTTGKLNAYHESQVYWPLIHMELTSADNPITLLLSFSHFYYVEFQRTPTGQMKKFDKPTLNFDHVRIREAFPQTCNSVDYSVLFKS